MCIRDSFKDFNSMIEKGSVGFSDDGDHLKKSIMIEDALKVFSGRVPLMDHPEDHLFLDDGVMNEGVVLQDWVLLEDQKKLKLDL